MSLFLLDLQKTLLVDHGGRRLLALLDHQMDKVAFRPQTRTLLKSEDVPRGFI
jgi:hypothetical protein